MRGHWVALIVIATFGFGMSVSAAEPKVSTSDGTPVAWSTWVAEHAPAAVVLWSSWAPDSRPAFDALDELQTVARQKGLRLVLVAVQEDATDAARVIGTTRIEWLSDRFGGLLKHYRVVRIPALVVIDADGAVVGRLEPTPAALEGWTPE